MRVCSFGQSLQELLALTLEKFSARDAFVQACLPTAVVTVLNHGGVAVLLGTVIPPLISINFGPFSFCSLGCIASY